MINIPSPNHPSCIKCGLFNGCKNPFMQPSVSRYDTDLMIIGESPGEDEDRAGKPFVGASGRKLREVLSALDVGEDYVTITNTVRCHPPDNKISQKHVNYCKQFVLDEIERFNPPFVALLGNSPLNAVLGQSGITNWNGVVVNDKGRTFIPLFHPAYILRNPEMNEQWIEGWVKLSDAMDGEEKEVQQEYEYIYPQTLEEIVIMLSELNKGGGKFQPIISYDLETTSLDPFAKEAKIIVFTFALQGKAWSFPFDHKDAWWTEIEKQHILVGIRMLMKNHRYIVGHNIKFDRKHSRNYQIDFITYGDTMVISHLLDSRKGIHSLKRLAGLYLGMYNYNDELDNYKKAHKDADPDRGGNYGNIPLEILLPYACMDSHATLELYFVLVEKLSKKQLDLHNQVLARVSDVLCDMEWNGMLIDKFIAERYMLIYGTIQQRLLKELLENKKVQRTVRHFQNLADQKIMDGRNEPKVHSDHISYIRQSYDKNGELKWEKVVKLKREFVEFNPNSTDQLRKLLFDYYKIPKNEVGTTETGLPSTEADGLKRLASRFPIVSTIIYYKMLTKMIGTYLRPATNEWLSDDGRVRSTYNMHGTVTGRPSSSDPNLMNIPAPEKEPGTILEWLPVRNIFTIDEGHDMLSIDYSGMELRVFASLAKCDPMLKIHESGMDFHSMVAILVSEGKAINEITPEEVADFKKNRKADRYRYKWTNWTLLYGGNEYTLFRLYNDDFPDLQLAKDVVNAYYATFPEVPEYMDSCVDFVQQYGYIESPFGRREHLPYLAQGTGEQSKINEERREAVNMPVQSGASDVLLCALVIIADQIKRNGWKSKLINTVYDSIVFQCPKDETDEVARMCVHVMENIKEYTLEYFPDIDFSWLLSPLKADADIGTHYGCLEEWKGETYAE